MKDEVKEAQNNNSIHNIEDYQLAILIDTKKDGYSYIANKKMSIFIKDINLNEKKYFFVNTNNITFRHNSIMLYNNKKNIIENIIILDNNQKSLDYLLYFFNKYNSMYIPFFSTKQMSYLIKEFISSNILMKIYLLNY